MILSAPDDPDVVVIGSDGGYRPGPTASAQGARIQGRAPILGHSWGASQVNRGGSPTQDAPPQGRPTTLGHSWGVSEVDRGGSYTQSRR
jgi:hypothetical protein